MRLPARKLIILPIVALLVLPLLPNPVRANVACSASVDRHDATTDEAAFNFQIGSSGSDPIQWIRITRPSPNSRLVSASTSWNQVLSDNEVTLTGDSISPSNSAEFQVNLAGSRAFSGNWIVAVSSTSGGSPVGCTGDLAISVTDSAPPIISGVNLPEPSSTSVSINWTTDEPATSQVQYGISDEYGSLTPTNSNLTLAHTLTITGLSPDTGYHFQTISTDSFGNTGYSDEFTLLTAVFSVTPTVALPIPGAETIKPTVVLSTKLAPDYNDSPVISGIATDNIGVLKVEYSIDGGFSWIKTGSATGLGTRAVSFNFQPASLEDGNYQILARAVDAAGNIGLTASQTLVIDRLPPLVGPNITSTGPVTQIPDSSGVIKTLAGVDQRISISAIGGPISIDLTATNLDPKKKGDLHFSLTKSQGTGLWKGIISSKEPGVYQLTATAIDGAGNRTERPLNIISAAEPGRVRGGSSSPIAQTLVTLYYQEPITSSWTVWDGSPYGELNPQRTGPDGDFKLFAPPGKYYLEVSPPGHRGLISQIFSLTRPGPINPDLTATALPSLNIGGLTLTLPFPPDYFNFVDRPIEVKTSAYSLQDKPLPSFSVVDTDGRTLRSIDLIGKPTVLSVLTTWAPTTTEQLPGLMSLAKNKDLNVIPVSVLETPGRVKSFLNIGRYGLTLYTDRLGTTVGLLMPNSIPTHYFVSSSGTIKKVVTGVLSEEELTELVSGL